MTKSVAKFLVVAALALAALPALAADTPTQQQPAQAEKQRLSSTYNRLAWASSYKKGAVAQSEMLRQRSAIKDMIKRLESGEQVAPAEIDRILQAR